MRQKAKTAGSLDGLDDLLRTQPAVVDLVVEAKGEEVVSPARGHLLADAHERGPVPALLTAALRLERVVVGQQHRVHSRAAAGGSDLRNRARAVRVRRVDVNHADEVGR